MNSTSSTNETSAMLAHALAHPIRLRILELLGEEGAYVMHLCCALGRPQANISQHLAVLRDARLVVDEREGMNVVYRVRDARLFELLEALATLARSAAPAPMPPPTRIGSDRRRGSSGESARGGRRRGREDCRCPRCRERRSRAEGSRAEGSRGEGSRVSG